MTPRSPDEEHRQATPLELFFDLVFVVAVAQAASGLHHGIAEGHALDSVVIFGMAFFGIWWAWMNFTWFASSYDNDDIPYRLLVFVQMTGALIMASGIEAVFSDRNFSIVVLGYVIMRVSQVVQYLRAAKDDLEHRASALRYAIGMGIAQLGWVVFLSVPQEWQILAFLVGAIIELVIPIWADRAAPQPWHAEHIRERYGLFTIIVLGECILSTSMAIQTASDEGTLYISLLPFIIGALLIVYSMWWLYFYQPADHLVSSIRDAFIWGYSHLFIFGAIAAVGAGLAVSVDLISHHAEISGAGAGLAVTLPVMIYVLSVWILHEHPHADNLIDRFVHPVIIGLIFLTTFTEQTVLLTGILLVILVTVRLIRHLE